MAKQQKKNAGVRHICEYTATQFGYNSFITSGQEMEDEWFPRLWVVEDVDQGEEESMHEVMYRLATKDHTFGGSELHFDAGGTCLELIEGKI